MTTASAPSPLFVVDANVLIEAHRHYYAFDLCPGFWDALLFHHNETTVCCIDKIRAELTGTDALALWVKSTVPVRLFHKTDTSGIVEKYRQILGWVKNHHFTEGAVEEFAVSADGWVAAYAFANSYTVVTQERSEPDRKNRVKLPDVCKQFGIRCCNTYTMLRHFEAAFSWTHLNRK